MNKKLINFALVLIVLVLSLIACTRSFTTAPVATQPVNATPPFAVGAQPTVIADIKNWTATAVTGKEVPKATPQLAQPAGGMGAGGEEVTNTPTTVPPTTVPPTSTTQPPVVPAIPVVKAEVVAPTVAVGRPTTYRIVYGEWPICIARRYNLDLDSFFAVNQLNMQSRILAGTVLHIPQSGTWSTVYGPRYWHIHPATYTVRAGDNINSIACYYGDIDPSVIRAANGLSGAYTLHVGQVLQIP